MSSRFRVLILCTGNSARSQMAEALLRHGGGGRLEVDSAGSRPAAKVNPLAIAVLQKHGLTWEGHAPQGLEVVESQRWDLVITVCDHAKEACPIFPGQPVQAHWSMPDPDGEPAFAEAYATIAMRVARLLALPLETMAPDALSRAARAIALVAPTRSA